MVVVVWYGDDDGDGDGADCGNGGDDIIYSSPVAPTLPHQSPSSGAEAAAKAAAATATMLAFPTRE